MASKHRFPMAAAVGSATEEPSVSLPQQEGRDRSLRADVHEKSSEAQDFFPFRSAQLDLDFNEHSDLHNL